MELIRFEAMSASFEQQVTAFVFSNALKQKLSLLIVFDYCGLLHKGSNCILVKRYDFPVYSLNDHIRFWNKVFVNDAVDFNSLYAEVLINLVENVPILC